MTILRSIETRMMEALRRDFLADADIAAYFRGVFVGPLPSGDPATIYPPQINISLTPNDTYTAGVGSLTKHKVTIAVGAYFSVVGQDLPLDTTTPPLNPIDYVRHLQLIALNGSIDPYTGLVNGRGYLLDPDYVVPDPLPAPPWDALRWLNTSCGGCTDPVLLFTNDNSAVVGPFLIDYEIWVITLTGQLYET